MNCEANLQRSLDQTYFNRLQEIRLQTQSNVDFKNFSLLLFSRSRCLLLHKIFNKSYTMALLNLWTLKAVQFTQIFRMTYSKPWLLRTPTPHHLTATALIHCFLLLMSSSNHFERSRLKNWNTVIFRRLEVIHFLQVIASNSKPVIRGNSGL